MSGKNIKFCFVLAILSLIFLLSVEARNWSLGKRGIKWAYHCDFFGYDISNVVVQGGECGKRCIDHGDCNAFFFSNDAESAESFESAESGESAEEQGICYLKNIPANLASSGASSGWCGYVPWRGSHNRR